MQLVKTFYFLFISDGVRTEKLDDEVNGWLRKNPKIKLIEKKYHTEYGLIQRGVPFVQMTVQIWYEDRSQ